MNPIEVQKKLSPVVGESIARSLALIARAHKDGAEFNVSVPSGVLVLLAEELAVRT